MTKKILCGVLVVVMLLSLVACGSKLSGTYSAKNVVGEVSYTFSGSKVVVKTFALGVKVLELEGTYEIKGDEITITYSSDDAKKDENVVSGTQKFEKGKDYIMIGSLKLEKQ